MFLVNYRAELSYDEGQNWKDKVIITEKAVARPEGEVEELNATKDSREDKTLAPSVKEMFDTIKAQEMVVENLPEPPKEDEIEEKLERLKKGGVESRLHEAFLALIFLLFTQMT